MVLEGAMVIIAVLSLTIFHPGVCFGGLWGRANFTLRRGQEKQGTVNANREASKEVATYELN